MRLIARLFIALLGAVAAAQTPATGPATAPGSGPAADGPDAAIALLGDDSYEIRDAATRALIAEGPELAPRLRAALDAATDPEVRFRLRHVIENITPPPFGALLLRVTPESGLRTGDIVTHVGTRRVRDSSEFRLRLAATEPQGAVLRVSGAEGPREVGPVRVMQVPLCTDFVAPLGETIARAVRLYEAGLAERAYEALAPIRAQIAPGELPVRFWARLAFCAGHADDAAAALVGDEAAARPDAAEWRGWAAPSMLDVAGPGKAPYRLEMELFERGGPALYASPQDPDLRIQRVLVPAGRFADALLRSAELWQTRYRTQLGTSDEGGRNVAGNQLAVAAWMLYELDLRSECCRLIEPRSEVLRRTDRGRRKWVRVDTDAWLPFLAGDEKAAVDLFFEPAMDVLQQPPRRGEGTAVIRNPQVAARLGFFLAYQPNDTRNDDALSVVGHAGHPVFLEYLDWMLLAVEESNHDAIRKRMNTVLPSVTDADALPYARAVALLEYVRAVPDIAVLQAARARIFQSAAGADREAWTVVVDALIALAGQRPTVAVERLSALNGAPEAAALLETARFLAAPPDAALNHESLRSPLLVVPFGTTGTQWLVLTRDRRLMRFDATAGTLVAIEKPDAAWFPAPRTWPWLGREPTSGRVWAYGRRRVVELASDKPLRLNIQTEDLPSFDRDLASNFSLLDESIALVPRVEGENGEFLRSEVKAHGDCVADPDLPDLAIIRPLDGDGRLVHAAFRGGPHLLIETVRRRAWTSVWIQKQLGLATPPAFFAQGQRPRRSGATSEPFSGVVYLFSDQGLLRFDTAAEQLVRIDLPGDAPRAAVIPESVPYERRDPRYVYFARLPEDGGAVYRLVVENGTVEPVNLVNEALPDRYYDIQSRASIRAMLDRRLQPLGVASVEALIEDAIQKVAEISKEHE